jgi:hypothetical protein
MRLSLSLLPWLAYPSEKTRVDKPHTRNPWFVCIFRVTNRKILPSTPVNGQK